MVLRWCWELGHWPYNGVSRSGEARDWSEFMTKYEDSEGRVLIFRVRIYGGIHYESRVSITYSYLWCNRVRSFEHASSIEDVTKWLLEMATDSFWLNMPPTLYFLFKNITYLIRKMILRSRCFVCLHLLLIHFVYKTFIFMQNKSQLLPAIVFILLFHNHILYNNMDNI